VPSPRGHQCQPLVVLPGGWLYSCMNTPESGLHAQRHGARFTRRTLLAAAGATALAAGLPVQAWAGGDVGGGADSFEPTPAESWMEIGPRSITNVTDLYYLPADANLVRWRWARSLNKTVQDAVAELGPRDILVLPEDERPYAIDSSRGFTTPGAWRAMVRVTRGIAGLGPGAVVEPSASSFRSGRQTYAGGLQEKLIESVTDGAYFGNFTMRGRSFGDVAYNGIQVTGSDATFQAIRFQGAHRGWTAQPPGEAAAITAYSGSRISVRNVEVDGRDYRTGVAVGTSPLMFNRNQLTIVTDTWLHHTSVGMPTWWECTDIWSERLYHSDVAQAASGWSPGINLENCSGNLNFIDPTLLLGYSPTGNTGRHLNVGGSRGTVGTVVVRNATFDDSVEPGKLSIQEYGAQVAGAVRYDIHAGNGSAAPFTLSR
jgi:hypothetical protein